MIAEPRGQVALSLEHLGAVELPRGLHVAVVGEDPQLVTVDDQDRVRALEAGQVEDVDRIRDQERPGAEPVQRSP